MIEEGVLQLYRGDITGVALGGGDEGGDGSCAGVIGGLHGLEVTGGEIGLVAVLLNVNKVVIAVIIGVKGDREITIEDGEVTGSEVIGVIAIGFVEEEITIEAIGIEVAFVEGGGERGLVLGVGIGIIGVIERVLNVGKGGMVENVIYP